MQFNIYVGSIFHQRVFGQKHQFKYKFFSGYFNDVYSFKDKQFNTQRFSSIFSLDFQDDGAQKTIKAIKFFVDKHQIDIQNLKLDLLKKPNFCCRHPKKQTNKQKHKPNFQRKSFGSEPT